MGGPITLLKLTLAFLLVCKQHFSGKLQVNLEIASLNIDDATAICDQEPRKRNFLPQLWLRLLPLNVHFQDGIFGVCKNVLYASGAGSL